MLRSGKAASCWLIEPTDVLLLKIPYPNDSSGLATNQHMYICVSVDSDSAAFVKCQSYKPYHVRQNATPFNRLVEAPDVARNPFQRPTLIDLDKLFVIDLYAFTSKTRFINPISQPLYDDIQKKMNFENMKQVRFSEQEIRMMNM